MVSNYIFYGSHVININEQRTNDIHVQQFEAKWYHRLAEVAQGNGQYKEK
jgi:hypothetical protein